MFGLESNSPILRPPNGPPAAASDMRILNKTIITSL